MPARMPQMSSEVQPMRFTAGGISVHHGVLNSLRVMDELCSSTRFPLAATSCQLRALPALRVLRVLLVLLALLALPVLPVQLVLLVLLVPLALLVLLVLDERWPRPLLG